jgi:MFS family permease
MGAGGGWIRNGALVRSLLSFGFAFTAEWAFTVAIGLVAFADGGALAVGLVGLLRLLPAAVLAPVIAAYADRVPREHVLVASSLVRGVSTLAAAPVLVAGGPTWIVYALAVVSSIAFTPFRASHSALIPSLCRAPDELTEVNVVRGGLDSLSVIVGPLVAALLVAVADVAAVFAFAGACGLVSAVLVLRLGYERIPVSPTQRPDVVGEVREGFVAVGAYPGTAVVVGLVVLQTVIRGAFSVFVLVVALDLLDGTESSVGVLQGTVGIGALVGSALCTLLVGSRAMTRWLGLAVVLWGAPLALMGTVPAYGVVLVAAGVIGIGNSLVDVTAFTLIARMVPNAVLARVFGVLESIGAFGVAVGALTAPLLIDLVGARAALVVVGAVAPVVCVLGWRRLTAIDRSVAVRTDDIAVLRRVPMLRPLPVPVIEQLAVGLEHVAIGPDTVVFEAGDAGDSFYVVAAGSVAVLDRGRLVRTMGPGEGFGEIALLGGTTRTMTVRAVDDVELYAVRRAVFLPAITSMTEARSTAEAARRSYLDHAPGAAVDDPDTA